MSFKSIRGKFQLITLAAFSLILLFQTGCSGVHEWTRQELTEWHTDCHTSPLFYRGSDTHYHYFICRPIDSFVCIKVEKNQIEMDDVKPYIGFTGEPFPGYYAVDSNNNYNRITGIDSKY